VINRFQTLLSTPTYSAPTSTFKRCYRSKVLRPYTRVAPRWRDGLHPRQHVIHEPNLVVIVDVRALGGRSATPIGWALLPVFERGTEFIASGAFQLPLFQARGTYTHQGP